MSHMTAHETWFARTTENASGRAAADLAGLPPATLNRQLGRGHLAAETVIAIARAYGAHPVGALVATGYLTPEEGGTLPTAEAAQLMSDQALIREVAYRVDSNPAAWTGTFDEVINEPDPHVRPALYVADSSPDEPEMGDDGYHDGP